MTDLAKRDELADMPPIPDGWMAVAIKEAAMNLDLGYLGHGDCGAHVRYVPESTYVDVHLETYRNVHIASTLVDAVRTGLVDVLVLVRERK